MSFRDYIPRHLWPFRVYVPSVRMSSHVYIPLWVYPSVWMSHPCIYSAPPPPLPPMCVRPLLLHSQYFSASDGTNAFAAASAKSCRTLTPIFRFTSKCQVSSRMDWAKRKDIGKGSSTVFLNENILMRVYCRALLNENGKCGLSQSRGLRGNTNKYCATYCADEIVKQKIWIERHPCRIYGH